MMSERELNRVEVLSQVSQGRMTAVNCGQRAGIEPPTGSPAAEDVFQSEGPACDPAQGARP
jgi:hypothetical protein